MNEIEHDHPHRDHNELDHGDGHGHGHHGHDHEHEHGHSADEDTERAGFTGKVVGLVYDRLGDFDGFLLQTDEGERAFDSRESGIEELAERAWGERILTTVFVDAQEPWSPVRIVLRA